jgi:hypothetical protein
MSKNCKCKLLGERLTIYSSTTLDGVREGPCNKLVLFVTMKPNIILTNYR